MMADTFGIEMLPASYGLMNGLKAILVIALTPLASPVSHLVYNVHPFITIGSWNETMCSGPGCDPLGDT